MLSVSALVAVLLLVGAVSAQTYPEIHKMLDDRKYTEVEKILADKLQTNPNDDSAHFYLGLVPLWKRESSRYEEAAKHLEKCIALKPTSSKYHMWLGNIYGQRAGEEGLMKAMGYVGKIRDAYKKAVELDPDSYQARYWLNQFYLQAPGIVGGGADKAKANANDFGKRNLPLSRLLWADIFIHDKKLDDAYTQLLSIHNVKDPQVINSGYGNRVANLINAALAADNAVKARSYYDRLAPSFAETEPAKHHLLGRVLFLEKKYDDAIQAYEKAISLNSLGSYYRLGMAYQAKNDKAKAIHSYEQYLAAKISRNKEQEEDARKRLKTLKG
jgi:tetratricopeptide (TPR) repeat protein